MLREVGDLPMVTQLLSGTASGMRGQQLNTDSEKLSGSWNLIEMESVGCLLAFGLIMVTDQLVGLGRGLGEGNDIPAFPRLPEQGAHCLVPVSSLEDEL